MWTFKYKYLQIWIIKALVTIDSALETRTILNCLSSPCEYNCAGKMLIGGYNNGKFLKYHL